MSLIQCPLFRAKVNRRHPTGVVGSGL